MTFTSRFALATLALIAGATAQAADINTLGNLNQAEFRQFSEDAAALVSYKPLIPADPLGLTGFDVGASATATRLQNRAVWTKAAGGVSVPENLGTVALRAHKGLPFDIDVGASIASVPTTNIRVIGGELRWAVLPGGVALPAVALRLAVSSLSGVDQLSLRTTSYDVSVSKGFLMLTPYAGIGRVHAKSTANGVATLTTESFDKTKVFGGVNLNLGLANVALEADKTGDTTSYGVKLGFRF
ncbi:MAG: hypothetical protein ABI574_19350 [Burkholderiales bacterium]